MRMQRPASQPLACTLIRQQTRHHNCQVRVLAFHKCQIDSMAVERKRKVSETVESGETAPI